MNIDEHKLINQIQNGDLEKFSKLYDRYIKKIYDFIFFKTFHKETAEDLTSLVFTKAFEKIESFDYKKASFSTWLYQIARNTVIDHYRSNKFENNIEDVWDLSADIDTQFEVEMSMELEKVKEYLTKFDALKRDIVIMRVWQGMSYQEIAKILNKSEDSCKMMFSRTINQLRKDMPLYLFILLISNIL